MIRIQMMLLFTAYSSQASQLKGGQVVQITDDDDDDDDHDQDDDDDDDKDDYDHLQLASSREDRLCKSRRLRGARVSSRGKADS